MIRSEAHEVSDDQRRPANPRVVYGVTVGASAFSLLRGQLAWLRSGGWRVTLVSTADEAAVRAAEREGVDFQPISMTRSISPLSDLRAFLSWIRLLRRIRPDAVNVSTPKAGLLGGLASWVLRVPKRLYVVRGLRLEGVTGLFSRVLWLSEWVTMRLATDVLFVSSSLARESQRRRLLKPSKSWVIGAGSSNGVPAEAISRRVHQTDSAELRAKLKLPIDAFVVGFIGRIARDKGLETLVKAMHSVESPEVRLVVIGQSEDAVLFRQLENLGERVRRIPWTDDLWGHLRAIDVLCLPTLREGFPNVVLEAAAAGIPAITTRATGAIDSVVDNETGFLIDVGDADTLADRISELAADRKLSARLGSRAQRRVVSDFKPERIWAGIDEILRGDTAPQHATRLGSANKGES